MFLSYAEQLQHQVARERLRYHESGHATCELALNFRIEAIVAGSQKGEVRSSLTGPIRDRAHALDAVTALYGGEIAECREYFTIEVDTSRDYEQIDSIAQKNDLTNDDLRACYARAEQLLTEHWPLVRALVDALGKQPELSGADVARIASIAPAGMRSRSAIDTLNQRLADRDHGELRHRFGYIA